VATFKRILDDNIPIWLVSFVEGTRAAPEKIKNSKAYAETHGLNPLDHVLLPRTKGFVATVRGLGNHIDAIYDVTIGYEKGVPTLWQYVKGYAPRAHLHVRRYPVDSLPSSDDELSTWLHERFQEKDKLLAHYYEHGAFPSS